MTIWLYNYIYPWYNKMNVPLELNFLKFDLSHLYSKVTNNSNAWPNIFIPESACYIKINKSGNKRKGYLKNKYS